MPTCERVVSRIRSQTARSTSSSRHWRFTTSTGRASATLFRRVGNALTPGGVFVLGDVVVPERPEDAQIEIDWVVDLPDRVDDQVEWLDAAGFDAEVVWSYRDLAVLRATRR